MKFLLALLLCLTACASRPPFHKLEDGTGYTARETPIPEILSIQLDLPPGTKDDFRYDYLSRAAGEECAARHFPYYDVGQTKDGNARAFCYAKNRGAHLGATFAMVAPAQGKPELRVKETFSSRPSPFTTWDVVRKVNGREVHDVAELKEAVYFAHRQNLQAIPVTIERSEIPLLLHAKIYDDADWLFTPESLAALRALGR